MNKDSIVCDVSCLAHKVMFQLRLGEAPEQPLFDDVLRSMAYQSCSTRNKVNRSGATFVRRHSMGHLQAGSTDKSALACRKAACLSRLSMARFTR